MTFNYWLDPEGKEAKWINGVLTLVDVQTVGFKFGVECAVRIKGCPKKFTIYHREIVNGKPCYWLKDEDDVPYPNYPENELELYAPKDITERIKTFEDAREWCVENGHISLCAECKIIAGQKEIILAKDILSYLKLRIITAALARAGSQRLSTENQNMNCGLDMMVSMLYEMTLPVMVKRQNSFSNPLDLQNTPPPSSSPSIRNSVAKEGSKVW